MEQEICDVFVKYSHRGIEQSFSFNSEYFALLFIDYVKRQFPKCRCKIVFNG